MSKWNSYAKKLDDAFRQAQQAYESELAKLRAAQKARDEAFSWSADKGVGEAAIVKQAKQQAAIVSLEAAKRSFSKEVRRIVDGYKDSVNNLKTEFKQSLDAANLVDPAAIDSNSISLLNSGIMSSADYAHMLEQFKDNSTMRRMIGQSAKITADAKKDDRAENAALLAVYNEAGRESYGLKEQFSALADASVRYMGSSAPDRPEFCMNMQAHWNDRDIREAIDSF